LVSSVERAILDGHLLPDRIGSKRRAHDMISLSSLKTLITNCAAEQASQGKEEKARLAAVALLIRVATADRDMSESKRKGLHAIVRSGFELDDAAAARLVEDGCAAERKAIDLYQFTRQIKDAFDEERRRRVVQMMWDTAYLEGGLNGFEANVIWRAADLLGVSTRQRVEMRQQAAAYRSVRAAG
jgi:uncharacterized tellurite resistance protein B-like protein